MAVVIHMPLSEICPRIIPLSFVLDVSLGSLPCASFLELSPWILYYYDMSLVGRMQWQTQALGALKPSKVVPLSI